MRTRFSVRRCLGILFSIIVMFSVAGCQRSGLTITSECGENTENGQSFEECITTEEGTEATLTEEFQKESEEKSEPDEAPPMKSEPDEAPPTPSRESEEEDISEAKEKIEIVYELDPEQSFYYVEMPLDGDIKKEGDQYVIEGEMHYAGEVVITWQQKELLDAGEAVLVIMYQGNEVDRVVQYNLGREYHGADKEDTFFAQYKGTNSIGRFWLVKSPESDQFMSAAGIELSAEPYNGVGYSLGYAEAFPKAYYEIILEREYRLEVPADTIIEPYYFLAYTYSYSDREKYEELVKQTWTVDRYCEEAIIPDRQRGHWLHIYEENGNVVKIVEPFTS